MALIQLNVHPRATTGKNANRRTRAGGRIPAVLYGARGQVANVEVDAAEFHKTIGAHGTSGIFTLNEAGSDRKAIALLREVQRHPVSDMIYHVDLFEIPPDRPITVQVPVEIAGESVDVKRGDAAVMWARHSVALSCLPSELPESIVADISALKTGDKLHVADLTAPVGAFKDDPEDLILHLQSTAMFVEAVAPAAAAEGEAAEGEAAEGEGAEDEAAAGEKEEKGKKDKDKD